jgi:hypothetical protein
VPHCWALLKPRLPLLLIHFMPCMSVHVCYICAQQLTDAPPPHIHTHAPQAAQQAERERTLAKLSSWHTGALAELLDVFDVPRPSEGNKEHKMDRVLAFLENPQVASSKDLAAQARIVYVFEIAKLCMQCWAGLML